ncbi:MAG: undecaprenyl/decaprenyl-phosphate alpha-N-acetylglucosaminyl 1-phosphate transferase [Flavobacteriales bacterium]|nr:undecaprenyl/decaprenyl-phosphate alpha-N-acetylglucosaminyl 1-phosphate transferase [Flavobacteriales bacterium]MBP9079861.1 undecaprenyl/decaprenyl-phosphate alpha-N-acetylglucosaminyl 1-phosphate transferase [Flavobacteriales bacterium]
MYTTEQLFFLLSGLFFLALFFTLLVNSLFMRFFHTFGIRENAPGLMRWNACSKPAFGGIGFFIVFLFGFAAFNVLFPRTTDPFRPELLGLLAATGLGFLMGLADDAYDTRPLLKFVTQICCGLLLLATGTRIDLSGIAWLDQSLTLLWVVGLMNAINLLDNMDAITSVVALAILVAALLAQLFTRTAADIHTVVMIAVCGALGGFLFFNWHPSRMYMGDTGSQFLGVFLAYVGIRFFWNTTALDGTVNGWRQVSVTVVVFILPLADTATVSINRLLKGGSPFVGGKDHTTHYLSYAGLTDPQVAMVFGGLGLVSAFLSFIALAFIPVWLPFHSLFYLGYALIVAGVLYAMTKRPQIARPL